MLADDADGTLWGSHLDWGLRGGLALFTQSDVDRK